MRLQARVFALFCLLGIPFLAICAPMAAAGLARLTIPEPHARLALVIGERDYANAPDLANAKNDALLVGRSLAEAGFEVTTLIDAPGRDIAAAVEKFARSASRRGDAMTVVYFAGQGVQIEKNNYLVPIDASLADPRDVARTSIALDWLVTMVATSSTMSLFLIDACRDNPFAVQGETRAIVISENANRGLAGEDLGHPILFATAPGRLALDGPAGGNGPFALALAKYIATPGLELTELIREVRNEVLATTNGFQDPTFQGSLPFSFYFHPSGADRVGPLAGSDPATRAAQVMYEPEPGELVPTYQDGSFALLIGQADYDDSLKGWRDLPAVTREVQDLAAVLEKVHGFEVTTVLNPKGAELEQALETFINQHGPKTNARLLFFLSGHGITIENKLTKRKTGWFVPADAPHHRDSPALFANTALNMNRVTEWLELIEAKHVLWIFDSCFSGQVLRMHDRKSDDRLRPWERDLHLKPVRRVITAGSENEEVPAQSRFAEVLIKVLKGELRPGDGDELVTGEELGYFLRQDLVDFSLDSGLPQHPQSDTIIIPDSESGDIIFRIEPALVSRLSP
jgi:uncharacterized caspase-like protein